MKNWLILAFLVSTSICAQENFTDSLELMTAQFDEVILSENRIEIPFSDASRSITVITSEDIKAMNATSINEVLQVVGGVDLRQRGVNGVQADISIRGGTFEQTLILLNGVRLVDPQTGHHMMNIPVDVQAIERIEVIKGPAARVYGQNAFAGAVNIITKTSESTSVTLGGEYGQHDLANIFVNAALPIGNYSQNISGAYNKSDGYRFNTDYEISNIFYQSKLDVSERLEVGFFGGYVDRKFGANSFYGRESFIDQYEEVQTSVANLNATYRVNGWKINPRLTHRWNRDNWQFNREDPDFFQNFHTTNVYTAETHVSKSHQLGILGFGVEYNNMNLESSNLKDSLDNGNHSRNQLALHVENRFLFLDDKLDVTPGVLLLKVSDYGYSLYPGVDVGLDVGAGVKLFSNVGWTSRIPTFTDLYYSDSGSVGNPNLEEESAFTAEFGIKYDRPQVRTQISYFSRNASDQIDWFRVTEEDRWMPDNFNVATYSGMDLSAQFLFKKKGLTSLRVAYTYISATFEANDFAFSRNQLENLRHQVVVGPQFNLGALSANFLVKYNDRVSLEDYYTVDANLEYRYQGYKAFIKGRNIFNEIYRESSLVEMPGRWMSVGLIYKFQ